MSFIQFRPIDILDVIIVSFIFYYILKLIRGTRATPMLLGLLFILFFSILASWWGLEGLEWLVTSVKTVWLVAFVIVFQPEIRRVLTELGTNKFVRFFVRYEKKSGIIEDIVDASNRLRERGIGGLICMERETGLKEYAETGTRLDAKVTPDLITTIFTPNSTLHDGAIIISNGKIASAGCILPVSRNPELKPELGMRHRAAIGITEETDALCIVVSEETRTVSIAVAGKLLRNLDATPFKRNLESMLRRICV